MSGNWNQLDDFDQFGNTDRYHRIMIQTAEIGREGGMKERYSVTNRHHYLLSNRRRIWKNTGQRRCLENALLEQFSYRSTVLSGHRLPVFGSRWRGVFLGLGDISIVMRRQLQMESKVDDSEIAWRRVLAGGEVSTIAFSPFAK